MNKKIVIPVILATLIAVGMLRNLSFTPKEQFRKYGTVKQLEGIKKALQIYFAKCGRYPTTAEGLNALNDVQKGTSCRAYFEGAPSKVDLLDKWQNEFAYKSDGKSFTVLSAGNEWIEIRADAPVQFPTRPE